MAKKKKKKNLVTTIKYYQSLIKNVLKLFNFIEVCALTFAIEVILSKFHCFVLLFFLFCVHYFKSVTIHSGSISHKKTITLKNGPDDVYLPGRYYQIMYTFISTVRTM